MGAGTWLAAASRLLPTHPPALLLTTSPFCVSENSSNQGGKEAETRQPLVILLGWGGCTDKNLAKYSAIYHKRVSIASGQAPSGGFSLGSSEALLPSGLPWRTSMGQTWEKFLDWSMRKISGLGAFSSSLLLYSLSVLPTL